ncbi:MAG: hypothetical protein IJM09_03210 [Neisseriaceae bacterium]|nr:hypothetical protein [Neisseriaceae bacterium]
MKDISNILLNNYFSQDRSKRRVCNLPATRFNPFSGYLKSVLHCRYI